jgi:hypothetical protein
MTCSRFLASSLGKASAWERGAVDSSDFARSANSLLGGAAVTARVADEAAGGAAAGCVFFASSKVDG